MIKTLVTLIFLFNTTFAQENKIFSAFAIAIYDEKGKRESLIKKRETQRDYNGICYTEIVVTSKKSTIPKIVIKNSLGHLKSSKPLYKEKIKIGEILLFKHYKVTSGYLKVLINNKVYDMKTFIK